METQRIRNLKGHKQNICKIYKSKRQTERKTDNAKVVEEQSELCGVENLTLATH